MRRSEGGEEREDAEDEAPTVVVLNKGDLTEEEAKEATEKEESADPPPDGRIRFKKPTKRYSLQHQCFFQPQRDIENCLLGLARKRRRLITQESRTKRGGKCRKRACSALMRTRRMRSSDSKYVVITRSTCLGFLSSTNVSYFRAGQLGRMSAAAALSQLASAHNLIPKVEQDAEETSKEESKEESPEVDIVINNVVCSFSVRCHLNLKEIALNGSNVEYRRENGMVTMKLRWVNLFEI